MHHLKVENLKYKYFFIIIGNNFLKLWVDLDRPFVSFLRYCIQWLLKWLFYILSLERGKKCTHSFMQHWFYCLKLQLFLKLQCCLVLLCWARHIWATPFSKSSKYLGCHTLVVLTVWKNIIILLPYDLARMKTMFLHIALQWLDLLSRGRHHCHTFSYLGWSSTPN